MENIHVALRIRPMNKREVSREDSPILYVNSHNIVSVSNEFIREQIVSKKMGPGTKTTFGYDYCFAQEEDNLKVYETVVRRIVLSSLKGINGTIFMYGQTGSGKTFTMLGTDYRVKPQHPSPRARANQQLQFKRQSLESTHLQKHDDDEMTHQHNLELFDPCSNSDSDGCELGTISEKNHSGVLIYALKELFSAIDKDVDKTYFIRCSYVEIYNDQIFDLLKPQRDIAETLTVNEDPRKDFYIRGVVEESVSSIDEILEKLKRGEENRHYAETAMNHSSSRSHTIFRISVQTVTNNFIRTYRRETAKTVALDAANVNNAELRTALETNMSGMEGTLVTESLLNFVDLAGSERVSNHYLMQDDSAATLNSLESQQNNLIAHHMAERSVSPTPAGTGGKVKERVREGQHINKSLFFLTQVISLKSEGKPSSHIPYRNSPLTKILRSSLGGNSRTAIILCVTPASSQAEQTMSTLRFGLNAKKIENRVQANIITNKDEEAMRILIADYEKKLRDLENGRNEERRSREDLLKQIDILGDERDELAEKLKLVSKMKWLSLAKGGSNLIQEQVQKANNAQELLLPMVGLVRNSSNLRKYDTCVNQICPSCRLRGGSQQLISDIFDAEGKYAVATLKKSREENDLLRSKLHLIQTNFDKLNARFKECLEGYYLINHDFNAFFSAFTNFTPIGNEFLISTQDSYNKLRLFHKLQGLNLIDDAELVDLEKHFSNGLDALKEEKIKRKLRGIHPEAMKKFDELEKEVAKSAFEDAPMLTKFSEGFNDLVAKLEEYQANQLQSVFYIQEDEIVLDPTALRERIQAEMQKNQAILENGVVVLDQSLKGLSINFKEIEIQLKARQLKHEELLQQKQAEFLQQQQQSQQQMNQEKQKGDDLFESLAASIQQLVGSLSQRKKRPIKSVASFRQQMSTQRNEAPMKEEQKFDEDEGQHSSRTSKKALADSNVRSDRENYSPDASALVQQLLSTPSTSRIMKEFNGLDVQKSATPKSMNLSPTRPKHELTEGNVLMTPKTSKADPTTTKYKSNDQRSLTPIGTGLQLMKKATESPTKSPSRLDSFQVKTPRGTPAAAPHLNESKETLTNQLRKPTKKASLGGNLPVSSVTGIKAQLSSPTTAVPSLADFKKKAKPATSRGQLHHKTGSMSTGVGLSSEKKIKASSGVPQHMNDSGTAKFHASDDEERIEALEDAKSHAIGFESNNNNWRQESFGRDLDGEEDIMLELRRLPEREEHPNSRVADEMLLSFAHSRQDNGEAEEWPANEAEVQN